MNTNMDAGIEMFSKGEKSHLSAQGDLILLRLPAMKSKKSTQAL